MPVSCGFRPVGLFYATRLSRTCGMPDYLIIKWWSTFGSKHSRIWIKWISPILRCRLGFFAVPLSSCHQFSDSDFGPTQLNASLAFIFLYFTFYASGTDEPLSFVIPSLLHHALYLHDNFLLNECGLPQNWLPCPVVARYDLILYLLLFRLQGSLYFLSNPDHSPYQRSTVIFNFSHMLGCLLTRR